MHVVAIVFIEVIRRFVFSYSSIWGEETARYAFIYLVWIGASAAIKDRSHIRIDIIFKFLSEKNKARLYIFTELTTLIFASVALYYSSIGVWETIKFDTLTSGLRVSQAWFTFAVPFGLTCLMVRVVQRIFLDILSYLYVIMDSFFGHLNVKKIVVLHIRWILTLVFLLTLHGLL